MPGCPADLHRLRLRWREVAGPVAVTGREAVTAGVRPIGTDGVRFVSYSEVMKHLARPRTFQDRVCYGLSTMDAAAARLEFQPVNYFANIDIGEALAHEYALAAEKMPSPGWPDLPLRRLIGDPLDVSRRPIPVAISTLVIRTASTGYPHMVLHWRDPAKVATGGGLFQVAPVGVFQPSHDAAWNLRHDFDLWRSILRELNEELLGGHEDYNSSQQPIDYAGWPLARRLDEARRAGRMKAFWLGAGIDPLTLVCDLLCVVCLHADVFDTVFADIVSNNDEGRLIRAEDSTGTTVGVPFTAETVARYASKEPMQPAGAAVLRLAWRHRDVILR